MEHSHTRGPGESRLREVIGRVASLEQAALIELADLVSEVQPVKHPLQRGLNAQRGIEF